MSVNTWITPFIEAKPVAKDRTYPSRADFINALPQLLEVVLSSPTGLTLINVGDDVPGIAHRNKPWLKPNVTADGFPSIFVWDTEAAAWVDIAPTNSADIMALAQEAMSVANQARTTAMEAKADADRAKEYAEQSEIRANEAAAAATAAETAAENAAATHSGVYFGEQTAVNVPVSPLNEAIYSAWVTIGGVPQLKTSPTPVAFMTLSFDSVPSIPFRYGAQVQVVGANVQVRVAAVNIWPVPDPPGTRTVNFMWMIKGEVA